MGCLVMGSGEDRMAAEMLAKEQGLTESLRFVGDVDHEMCLALMAQSHAFVRPTFRDGDSISVREAVSLGIPVVASNVGTRPAEAMLFEAGNVEEMISQIAQALDLGHGTLEKPSVDSTERLLGIYSALL
jgi:glycosyltransferase involved in cell wall biosynthesis